MPVGLVDGFGIFAEFRFELHKLEPSTYVAVTIDVELPIERKTDQRTQVQFSIRVTQLQTRHKNTHTRAHSYTKEQQISRFSVPSMQDSSRAEYATFPVISVIACMFAKIKLCPSCYRHFNVCILTINFFVWHWLEYSFILLCRISLWRCLF